MPGAPQHCQIVHFAGGGVEVNDDEVQVVFLFQFGHQVLPAGKLFGCVRPFHIDRANAPIELAQLNGAAKLE